jgi:hypothetical protein
MRACTVSRDAHTFRNDGAAGCKGYRERKKGTGQAKPIESGRPSNTYGILFESEHSSQVDIVLVGMRAAFTFQTVGSWESFGSAKGGTTNQ